MPHACLLNIELELVWECCLMCSNVSGIVPCVRDSQDAVSAVSGRPVPDRRHMESTRLGPEPPPSVLIDTQQIVLLMECEVMDRFVSWMCVN